MKKIRTTISFPVKHFAFLKWLSLKKIDTMSSFIAYVLEKEIKDFEANMDEEERRQFHNVLEITESTILTENRKEEILEEIKNQINKNDGEN